MADPGHETILVIGNGMVSHRLCDRLTQAEVAEGATATGKQASQKIVVLGEESRPAYDRLRLGEMLRGRRATSLSLARAEWYSDRGIELVLGDPVVSVDRTARIAETRSGRAFSYDRLVFATGAAPVVPKLSVDPGAHIVVIRTAQDLEQLRGQAEHARSVVVMGGGLLGLETAKSLLEGGLAVTVVEAAPQLMARQLDSEAAEVLKRKLERMGITVVLGAAVQRLALAPGAEPGATPSSMPSSTTCGKSAASRLRMVFMSESGRAPLDVDLVVASVGVRPRSDLAAACGLAIAKGGGIAVDKELRTSDPAVYAMGDCASVEGVSFGLLAPGYRMADALAATLRGTPTSFETIIAPVKLKVAGVDVVALGQTRAPRRHRSYRFRRHSVYRRVVVEDGRLIGATSIGGWPELGAVQAAIADERELTQTWYERFSRGETTFRGDAAPTPRADLEIVCACARVSAGAIRSAIAGGCRTADAVSLATGAARGCGSCLPLVTLMVGGQPAAIRPAPRRWMAGFAAATLGALAWALVSSPSRWEAVLDGWGLDRLARDPFWQVVSGFTLLGCCALAMVLPLVKRALRASGSKLPLWRAVHGGIGLAALAALVGHTSLRRGQNLNLALEASLALLLVLGAGAGLFSLRPASATGRAFRLAHLIVFWPLLSLIGLHVLAVYYF